VIDLRFAVRQLLKSPGFTLLAVLTLAVGIGMNTAIFSLINDLFLRGLPFPEPDRLVRVYGEEKERNLLQIPFSIPRFEHYREAQTVFTGIAADAGTALTLTGVGDPVPLNSFAVSANYFEVLGVQPIRGRLFQAQEEMKVDVALVSEGFWRKRLGSDPAVIGRSITLNDVSFTIVGVLPNMPAAWFGRDSEVWTPRPFEVAGVSQERLTRGTAFLRVIGRLRPGVTIDQARAAMPSLAQGYRTQHPENNDANLANSLRTLGEDVSGDLRPAFATLVAAVGFVLLIACSNVANLLLIRFGNRRREIALRMALGASRKSVVRLFIIESTLVSLVAGAIGTFLAWQLVPLIPKIAADNLPLEANPSLSVPVLGFSLVLALLTGFVMGAYPAWQSSRADLVVGLKTGGRAIGGGAQRMRHSLVVAQVALSLVLLAGAAVFVTSFLRLSRREAGFRPDNVWVSAVNLPTTRYSDPVTRAHFIDSLRREVLNSRGIESVALSESVPFEGFGRTFYARADANPPPVNQRPLTPRHPVSPGFFKTLGIALVSGRDFNERDTPDRPAVVIINQAGAKRIFPNEDPIGRELLLGVTNGVGYRAQIVGVVGDVRWSQTVLTNNEVEVYRPLGQEGNLFMRLAVNGTGRPEELEKAVRVALNKIDPTIALVQSGTMDALVQASLGQARLTMSLIAGLAAIALFLATIGIYGAVASTVAQRTAEIGVRMALGASTRDVLRLTIGQGMKPVLIGLAIGLAGVAAMGRLITAQLHEVSAHNPVLLAATSVTLAVVALLACLIPARRASLVNPIEALRTE
jgi:predicted permease